MNNNNKNQGSHQGHDVVAVTDQTFVHEVIEAETPVLVDFWATWCGPCKFMAPIFASLATQYEGKVKFAKVDVDENPEVSMALQIQSIPTFAMFKGNTVVSAGVGARREEDMRKWIDQALAQAAEVPSSAA